MKQDFEDRPAKQRHRQTVTLATVSSVLTIVVVVFPIFGWLAAPHLTEYFSTAMADEIRGQVQEQVTPVNAGLKVLIQNNIAELEDEISAMEYRARNNGDEFTALDAQNLTTKKRRLRAQQEALLAIIEAERTRRK